jgi:hypothetical protein
MNLPAQYKEHIRHSGKCLLLIIFVGLATGCIGIQVRGGEKFDVGKLETLHVGESTKDEVRGVLGEPYGEGSSMLPFHDSPRETWYYYYFEGTITDGRQKILLIYLDGTVYDGYMWFSSLPE